MKSLMAKITLSLSNYYDKKLRSRAVRNHRSISKEVEYLISIAEELKK